MTHISNTVTVVANDAPSDVRTKQSRAQLSIEHEAEAGRPVDVLVSGINTGSERGRHRTFLGHGWRRDDGGLPRDSGSGRLGRCPGPGLRTCRRGFTVRTGDAAASAVPRFKKPVVPAGSDPEQYNRGKVTVTRLRFDWTARGALRDLASWNLAIP